MRPTFTGCRWDSNAYKVLEGQHAGQKAAVFGPDLSDGFPPSFVHDRYQSKGVKHGVEVHPLANHVDAQKQARLRETEETKTLLKRESSGRFHLQPSSLLFKIPYLEAKLVEEVVDEVLDEADDANVQMLPRDVMENDARGRR